MFLLSAISRLVGFVSFLIFGGITLAFAHASSIHFQNGDYGNFVPIVIVATISLLFTLTYGMPTVRMRFVEGGFPMRGRVVFLLCTLTAMALMYFGAQIVHTAWGAYIAQYVPDHIYDYGLLAFLGIFALTYILPGFAFEPYRLAEEEPDVDENGQAIYSVRRAHTPEPGTDTSAVAPARVFAHYLFFLLFFAIAGLAFYGLMFSNFLPNTGMMERVSENSVQVLYITAGVLTTLALMSRKRIESPLMTPIFIRKTMMVFCGAMASLLLGVAVSQGLTGLHALAMPGDPAEETVVVVDGGPSAADQSVMCPRSVQVARLDKPYQVITLCGVPAQVWQTLYSGEMLKLEGNETSFGLHYANMTPVR